MNTKRFTLILFFALCILLTASACAAKSRSATEAQDKKYENQAVAKPAEVQIAAATQAPQYKVIVTQEVEKIVTQLVEKEVAEAPVAAQPTAEPQTIPTPVDNYFQDYGVNPFIDTDRDHLSTFAIDVDTA